MMAGGLNYVLQRVNDLIEGFEYPYGMELLAAVHRVLLEDSKATTDPDLDTTLVHKWNARKQKVVPPPSQFFQLMRNWSKRDGSDHPASVSL